MENYQWREADLIGNGLFSQVYKGLDSVHSKDVAIKVFQKDFELENEEEVNMLKALNHKNIVKVYDSGLSSHSEFLDRYIICMEYCSGQNLSTILAKDYPKGLNDDKFLLVMECLHKSVKYLRSRNIVHRDINASNICEHMDHFKLVGFSFATFVVGNKAWSFDQYAAAHGSVAYWHPRIFQMYLQQDMQQEATLSTKEYIDLWSIGATLYEAATGRLAIQPIECDNVQQMIRKMNTAFEIMQPNVISMIEEESNDSSGVQWKQEKDLPKDIGITQYVGIAFSASITTLCEFGGSCMLFFRNLAAFLKQMLTRLMEREGSRMWRVDEFFQYCKTLNQVFRQQRIPRPVLTSISKEDSIVSVTPERDPQYQVSDFHWTKLDEIWKRPSCVIYKGRHRIRPNMLVAVKEFPNDPMVYEEMEMLSQLKHQNIVQAYAHGKALEGVSQGHYVIIMEYCNGKSLTDLLKEHSKGLNDELFTLLIKCFRESFCYLRSRSILHRDFKALNVCLHTENEEEKLFKLIDFGLSKCVKEGDEMSVDFYLAGTPIYWHPRLNSKAFRKSDSVTKSNKAYVDLWAMGVTIFEAATGRRPFLSKQKHKHPNTIAMLEEAYKEKKAGVICMEQEEDGEWVSHTELPEGISISQRIIALVTPMLAGLMEKEPQNMWTVEKFIDQCDQILRRSSVQEIDSSISSMPVVLPLGVA